MPELPEVHTITTDLNLSTKDYKIQGVTISKGYIALPNNDAFTKLTLNQKIIGAERIAKNILIKLGSGNYILIHLAMTGRVLLRKSGFAEDGRTKVKFLIQKGSDKKELRFTDTRMFGKILVTNAEGISKLKLKYGPEPLDPKLAPEKFLEIIKSKKTNIKNVLLDQTLVSGLGNIYATDALFLAGIAPTTNTANITLGKAKKLLETAKLVLSEGIKNRGSTLPDKSYVDIFGREGKQQEHFKIYMKDNCPKCKSKVLFMKLNGRGTYYCEVCQPLDGQTSLFK